jgi:hypothetical protein
MGRMVVLVVASALCLGACGGDEDDAADTSGASTTARRGEPIVIRGELIVAATAGSEPTATGTILPGFHTRGLDVLRRRDDPGFPCKPRSQDEAVPDRPQDHLHEWHREDRYHPGGQRGAAASDPDRLVDDRERDRSIRTARRKREKRSCVRLQPQFAGTGDTDRERHALRDHAPSRSSSGVTPEGFREGRLTEGRFA